MVVLTLKMAAPGIDILAQFPTSGLRGSYPIDQFCYHVHNRARSMLSLTFAFFTFISYHGDISENVLNSRVFFAFYLQNVTVSETVRKMREYRIPISFIQSEESSEDTSKRLSVRVKDRTLREFLLDIVSQAKGYKFGIIENHLILYPSEKKYESVVDAASVGTRNRIDAISEFLSALKEQIQGFDNLRRPVLNNPEYFKSTLYTEPISMPPRTTVLKGFTQILGGDPYAILTIEGSNGMDRRIRLDLIKPLKESQLRGTHPKSGIGGK